MTQREHRWTIAALWLGALTISVCIAIAVTSRVTSSSSADAAAPSIAKARAYDAHCERTRFAINGIRRDLLHGETLESIRPQYRDLRMHDFENVTMCMLKADGDPMFFPEPCDFTDKACVLNQLDIFLLMMR